MWPRENLQIRAENRIAYTGSSVEFSLLPHIMVNEMSDREALKEPLLLSQEIMQTPHGDLTRTLQVHEGVRNRNPLFYVKFAAWYIENGTVRDHKVAFLRTLFNSEQSELREAAWMLLQKVPFELLYRVVDEKYPRTLRSAVIHRLANENPGTLRFQLLRAAKHLKTLVKRLHIPTSKSENENLQVIGRELFSKNPELRAVFKQLRQTENPEEISRILRRTRIPSYVAVSALKVRTPRIMKVLIENMTPSELLQSLNTLGRMKVLQPNLDLIIQKIEKAITDKRISAMRIHRIRKHLDPTLVPSKIFDLLSQVTVKKIKRISKIKGKVSIHVDGSGSMTTAIPIARQLATTLSVACQTPPTVYVASVTPSVVKPQVYNAEGWEKAFSLVRAEGGTPLGAGLALMKKLGDECDTLILITDEGENTPPYFLGEYQSLTYKPQIIIVRVGMEHRYLSEQLDREHVPYDVVSVQTADQYSLDQIVKLIGKSPFDVVLEIMNTPIPEKPPKLRKPEYWKISGES